LSLTFQPPSKSYTTRDYIFIALVIIVFIGISIGLISANRTLTGGGGDFYVHWIGAKEFIQRVEPYGGEVAAQTQQLVYGRGMQAGEEPFILDTPFNILLFYFPFSLLSDPEVARSIFTWILELALFSLAAASLYLTDWESPRLFAVLFVFFAVFNFYAIQALYEASPVLLLGLLYAGIILCLRFEFDELAGAMAALSCYYWEVGAPFLILVALHAYYLKRTGVFAGFFMLGFILLAVSLLIYPNWIFPYLRAVSNNLRFDFGYNVRTVFIHLMPAYGRIVAWIFIIALFIILGYEWSVARGPDPRRFYWASCLSIAAAPLLGFRTEMEHLSVLIIPLALIFAIVHDRWHRIGDWLTVLLLIVVFALPWALYLFAVSYYGSIAREMIFLFLPIFTLVGLYWIRWWALRPPRIWTDLAKNL
jgi:hypothetical protein